MIFQTPIKLNKEHAEQSTLKVVFMIFQNPLKLNKKHVYLLNDMS